MRISDWSSDVCSSDLNGSISVFMCCARGRFNSEIGRNAADDDCFNAPPAKLKVEVSSVEGAPLVFCDPQVGGPGQSLVKFEPILHEWPFRRGRCLIDWRDRQSTRLNSSH